MNKELISKYVIKNVVGSFNANDSSPSTQSAQLPIDQEPSSRKWWQSKPPKPENILSPKEKKILKKVKARAYFLDKGVSCCCVQIRFDGLIGLIPFIGDFIGLILAFQLVEMAMEAVLPGALISKMMFNIMLDFAMGLLPIIGDILDILYKCNTRNAILLENYLLERRQFEMSSEAHILRS
ncbi:hypothetical protein BDF14DRAFT_1827958 [Spinellus fusiger]|nr:hypothetical protein BDF14DRAFT_1827958 [Spinellus fusiger]